MTLHRWPVAPTVEGLARGPAPLAPRHVHVVPSLSLGGAERIVLDVAAALSDLGAPADVAVMRDSASEHPLPRTGPVRLARLGHLPWATRIDAVADLWRGSGLPVLCHLTSPTELGQLWDRGVATVPVVHNATGGWRQSPAGWDVPHVPFVVACGEAVADDLRAARCPKPVRVIRHVVPWRPPMAPLYRSAFRDALGGGFLIGMVGRLVAQKNHPLALEVLRGVLARSVDARLVVMGSDAGQEGRAVAAWVRSRARDLGIGDRVLLLGAVPDAARLLGGLDAFLLTSFHEGVSIATMEAIQAGVPVVTADVGGQREALPSDVRPVPLHAPVATWVDAVLSARRSSRSLDLGSTERRSQAAAMCWGWAAWAATHSPASGSTLFVTGNLDVGGAQRSLCNLLEALARRGHAVECAVAGQVGVPGLMRGALAAGARFTDASGAQGHRHGLAGRIGRVLSVLAEGGHSRLVFWNMDAATKAGVAGVLRGSRVAVHDVSPGPDLFLELEEASDDLRALSTSPAGYVASLTGFVAKYHGGGPAPDLGGPRTAVVPNGVPPAPPPLPLDQGPRPADGCDASRAVVVVGRLVTAKQPRLLPLVARRLAELSPGATLTVVGGGHGRREEAAMADMLDACGGDLPSGMRLLPPDDRTTGWLGRFAALLMLSTGQGCPNASLEALSCGVPVVANDDGGTREQVIDGVTGFLVAGDPAAMVEGAARALARIVGDPGLRGVLSRAAVNHVARNFSMDDMASGYERALGLGIGDE